MSGGGAEAEGKNSQAMEPDTGRSHDPEIMT